MGGQRLKGEGKIKPSLAFQQHWTQLVTVVPIPVSPQSQPPAFPGTQPASSVELQCSLFLISTQLTLWPLSGCLCPPFSEAPDLAVTTFLLHSDQCTVSS